MRSWELKGYVNKYSKLGKMDLIWLTNNKIKQAYLFSWLERYCEIIIGKRDRSSDWLHVWPINFILWLYRNLTCGETFHNFLLDSCLLYVLGVLFGLYSVNCIKHMIRHQNKVALQLCGEFHGKHNTIDSSAVFDTMVNGLN